MKIIELKLCWVWGQGGGVVRQDHIPHVCNRLSKNKFKDMKIPCIFVFILLYKVRCVIVSPSVTLPLKFSVSNRLLTEIKTNNSERVTDRN